MNNVTNKDIIRDLLNLAPSYLGYDIDKNRVSTFGYITEAMAMSMEDSAILARHRMANNIVELSDDDENIRATAKVRKIESAYPRPSKIQAALFIRREDIIANGIKDGMNYTFILDRRSILRVNDIPFTLKYNIVIKAIYKSGKYIYTANYADNNDSEFILIYNTTLANGESRLALYLNMYQLAYRTEERIIIDLDQWTYEGINFEHEKLTDFDVSYRPGGTTEFLPLSKSYFRFKTEDKNTILFNDDKESVLTLYNNLGSVLTANGDIRVTFKETLGSAGNFDTSGNTKSFSVFSDDYYKFSGFDVIVDVLSDATGGTDGDTIPQLKEKLILMKLSRNILVTDKDIKNAFKYKDDLVVLKKRNDTRFRLFYLYQLLRNGEDIVPTTTKNVLLKNSDFDLVHPSSLTKVIQAHNIYTMMPEKQKTMIIKNDMTPTELAAAETDVNKLAAICPFAYNINSDNILAYYLNFINRKVNLRPTFVNEQFEYNLILLSMQIKRNPYIKENHDKYTIEVEGILNTDDRLGIVNAQNEIVDINRVVIYVIFKNDLARIGYLPLTIVDYDPVTAVFKFTGSFTSNDYITQNRKLQITGGMLRSGTTEPLDDVIDYVDMTNDLIVTFNDAPVNTSDEIYAVIPNTRTISGKYDNTGDKYNLIVECNKFSRSNVKIIEPEVLEMPLRFLLNEVPLIKYSYLLEHVDDLYERLIEITEYNDIVEKLSDNSINVKYINTYGKSKYITVGTNTPLNNLNPVLKFKVYGKNIDMVAIKTRIRDYFSKFKTDNIYIFISNINTIIEKEFPNVESIEYLGVDNFDSTHQKFKNDIPDRISLV